MTPEVFKGLLNFHLEFHVRPSLYVFLSTFSSSKLPIPEQPTEFWVLNSFQSKVHLLPQFSKHSWSGLSQLYSLLVPISFLVGESISVVKHHGEVKMYFSLLFWGDSPSVMEVGAGTQAVQEPEGRNWSRNYERILFTILLIMACSVYLLYSTHGTTHNGLTKK